MFFVPIYCTFSDSYCNIPAYKVYRCRSGPEVVELFSCSTRLSTKFQLLIKTKIPTDEVYFLVLGLPDVAFVMLINVKMPKLLTFWHL